MDQDENSPWRYKPDNSNTPADKDETDEVADSDTAVTRSSAVKPVRWEAPEYIDRSHGPGWYSLLVIVTAALSALIYLISKDIFATATTVIVGVIVAVFVRHKPGKAKYEISDTGLSVDGRVHKYSDFKSFAVYHEGQLLSVNLFPLKRLAPPVSAYFEPADEKKITDTLGNYLPYEDRGMDAADRLIRRLRL